MQDASCECPPAAKEPGSRLFIMRRHRHAHARQRHLASLGTFIYHFHQPHAHSLARSRSAVNRVEWAQRNRVKQTRYDNHHVHRAKKQRREPRLRLLGVRSLRSLSPTFYPRTRSTNYGAILDNGMRACRVQ